MTDFFRKWRIKISSVLFPCGPFQYLWGTKLYVSANTGRTQTANYSQWLETCLRGSGMRIRVGIIMMHVARIWHRERWRSPGAQGISSPKTKNINISTGCPIKKASQAFGSCSRTRVPILFKVTMNIVQKMAKIIVTKANSMDVLPHLECVLPRRLHFCCFHWTRQSLLKKFGWDDPKTRFDFEKCPEQKDKSLRTPLASNHDRNRLWDVRQCRQPPPFGGPWSCPRWSAGSGPTSSAFFKSLLRVTHKMFMLITDITCFAIYLATYQCIYFYFWGNISSFMTENNSSRFFWTPGIFIFNMTVFIFLLKYQHCHITSHFNIFTNIHHGT